MDDRLASPVRRQAGFNENLAHWTVSFSLRRDLPVCFILVLLTVAIYSNSLDGGFVYDDVVIRDSSLVHADELWKFARILETDRLPRKVGLLSFALNYYLDGLDPFGYHLVNLAIHAGNGLLFFALSFKLLTLLGLRGEGVPSPRLVAGMGTAIWLAHPVQTQAVAYIYQRYTSLGAFFFLLSLLAYVAACQTGSRDRAGLFVLSALSGLLALGTKENTATLPLFVLFNEFHLLQASPRFSKRNLLLMLCGLLLFLGIAATLLGPHFLQMIAGEYERRGFTLTERLLTETRVVSYYVSLLAFPHPSRLNLDYDFPLSTSLFSPPSTLIAIAFLLTLAVSSIVVRRSHPLATFTVFWFLGNLMIESTIIPLDLIYEHRLYLPSMAVCLFIAALLVRAAGALKLRSHVSVLAAAPIICLLGYWSHERVRVWKDPITLWEDNARKSPRKARVRANLGKAYLDARRYLEAKEEFEAAIALEPKLSGAYGNLANIYLDYLGDLGRARQLFEAMVALNPDHVAAHVGLGVIHLRLGEVDQARARFLRVLELEPTSEVGLFNLATTYFNMKEYARAREILERGLEIWPRSARLLALLGGVLLEAGESERAEQMLAKALAIDEHHHLALFFLKRSRSK